MNHLPYDIPISLFLFVVDLRKASWSAESRALSRADLYRFAQQISCSVPLFRRICFS